MRKHNQIPQVVPLQGRKRAIEWMKDLLIVLLTGSALLLVSQTSLAARLRGKITEPSMTAEPQFRQRSDAVKPFQLTVQNERGLYGVSYQDDQVDRAFRRLSSILGEALASASVPEPIDEARWRDFLVSPGFSCTFLGEPPLTALSAWLGGGKSTLPGGAETILVAWNQSHVWLCWKNAEQYQIAPTDIAYEGYLSTALDEFNPNGAVFAYTMAAIDNAYAVLDPYVLIAMSPPEPAVYTASTPDFTQDSGALGMLLSALDFQTDGSSAYEVTDGFSISEGTDRLRIKQNGSVSYYAGSEHRYPVVSETETPTAEEAAAAAWDLLSRAASLWKGSESLVLTGAEEIGGNWIVTFHYQLGGIPVEIGSAGYAAQFTVSEGEIRNFHLTLRTCADTETTSPLLRERLAAAILRSLPENTRGDLHLIYTGVHTLTAQWRVSSS